MYLFHDSYTRRPDTPELLQIYSYVRATAKKSASQVRDDFYRLLWDGNAFPDQKTYAALQSVVLSSEFREYGLQFINRCYYTVCNPLHLESRHDDLAALILHLEKLPAKRGSSPHVKRLRDLLNDYRQSDYYKVLKRHMRLIDKDTALAPQETIRFGDQFKRYFFVYMDAAQTRDIYDAPEDLNSGIWRKRDKQLRQLRNDLATFQRSRNGCQKGRAFNPTGLSDEVLVKAFQVYRPGRKHSFKNQAKAFEARSKGLRTIGEYKEALLQHIMNPLSEIEASVRENLRRRLRQLLSKLNGDEMPINRTSKITVCQKLLSEVMHHNEAQPNSNVFYLLIKKAGHQVMTGFLLNLTLTCQMVRHDLERRFAHLFHIFENRACQTVQWLVDAFEHMNVALALNAKYLGYFGG
jgi:hypothetical protein